MDQETAVYLAQKSKPIQQSLDPEKNCQTPYAAQHNLNCRLVLHENDFTPPFQTKTQLQILKDKRQCLLTQSYTTLLSNLRHLSQTILDNYPRLY